MNKTAWNENDLGATGLANRLRRELGLAWNGLLDLLYPPRCAVCHELGSHPLCADCLNGFLPLDPPFCTRCGIAAGTDLCAECEAGAARHFALARAAGRFDGTLRRAIIELKYHGRHRLGQPIGQCLADYLSKQPFGAVPLDVVVPVPLHPSRMRERGFNQAALLAREVGMRLLLPVNERDLLRLRRTRPQVELKPRERAANIQDAFGVRRGHGLEGKTVLLIDDVVTTCHTVDECARVLLNAGVKEVYVASAARGG